MKALRTLAAVAVLFGTTAARAHDTAVVHDHDDDVDLEVHEHEHRNPVGVVVADTLYGGLAGAAVSGGIIGYQMGIQDRDDYDWKPVLATGVGIGLAAGLVFGLIDVAGDDDHHAMANGPVRDGHSWRDLGPRDQSGAVTMPLSAVRW